MNTLIAKSFKAPGSHFPGSMSLAQKSRASAAPSELIQLESSGFEMQGLDGLLEDMVEEQNADPAPETPPTETNNVETADEDQTPPAAEQNAATETQAAPAETA